MFNFHNNLMRQILTIKLYELEKKIQRARGNYPWSFAGELLEEQSSIPILADQKCGDFVAGSWKTVLKMPD